MLPASTHLRVCKAGVSLLGTAMCGRAVQAKGVIPLAVFSGIDVPDSRVPNVPPRGPPRRHLKLPLKVIGLLGPERT
jgi:hypothetical protein